MGAGIRHRGTDLTAEPSSAGGRGEGIPSPLGDRRDWHNASVVAPGRDEEPPGPSADPRASVPGTTGPVFDLWSLPPGALNLDEALMDEEATWDRLAAVLPVLGPDLDSDLTDPVLPGPPAPRSGAEPGPGRGAEAASGSRAAGGVRPEPRSRRGTRRDLAHGRTSGLSVAGLVALLVVVYVASTAAVLAWDRWRGPAPSPAGPAGGKVVIDGPPSCPMYRSQQPGQVQSSGDCFFVG